MSARGPYEHTGVYTPANLAAVQAAAPAKPAECGSCLGRVDSDGVTLGDCPVFRAADGVCPECYACFCDGSC